MFPTRRITTMGGDVFRDEFSLAFDGTNDYVNCGTSATLRTASFSVAVWVKFTDDAITGDDPGKNTGVVSSANSTNDTGFSITKPTSNKIEFRVGNGSTLQSSYSTTTLVADRWYHVVQTYDGDYQKAYLDGVLEDSDNYASYTVATGHFGIGKYYSHTEDFLMNGNISEVAYYDTALTASQVATIYNGREPYNHKEGIVSGNLKGWWRMGDEQGSVSALEGDTIAGGTGVIADQTNKKSAVIKEWDFSSDTDGFGDYSGNSVSQSTAITNHLGGAGVLKCENNDTSDAFLGKSDTVSDSTFGIEAEKIYLVEYYIYVPSSWSGTCEFRLQEASMSSKRVGLDLLRPTSAIKDSWQYGKNIFSPIATDVSGFLYPQTVSESSLVADDFVYISGVKLTEYENTNHGVMFNFPLGSIEGDTP